MSFIQILYITVSDSKCCVAAEHEAYHWYEHSLEVIICHMHESIHINLLKTKKDKSVKYVSSIT